MKREAIKQKMKIDLSTPSEMKKIKNDLKEQMLKGLMEKQRVSFFL